MSSQHNPALLRIIAMILLCAITLTGCLGTDGIFQEWSNSSGKDYAQSTPSGNTAHQHSFKDGICEYCSAKDPSDSESASSMVWIPTKGGVKYHSRFGCSNMKDPEQVTLKKAKELGFTACKKCYR